MWEVLYKSLYEGSYSTIRHGVTQVLFSRNSQERTCIHWLNMHLIYSAVVPGVYIRNSISIKTMYYHVPVSTVLCTSIALSGGKEKKVTT